VTGALSSLSAVRSRAPGVAVLAAIVMVGCGGPSKEEASRDAQVYVATIRDVLQQQPTPHVEDALPVVFIVGLEKRIAAKVQAEVAAALDDEAEIRFADERSEVVLEHEEDEPVRDDGVLVLIGPVTTGKDPVRVDVEVYRSTVDSSKRVVTVGMRSSQWTVTSESVVPSGTS
jgi:hypothetical protein